MNILRSADFNPVAYETRMVYISVPLASDIIFIDVSIYKT